MLESHANKKEDFLWKKTGLRTTLLKKKAIFTLAILSAFIYVCNTALGQSSPVGVQVLLHQKQALIGEPVILDVKVKTRQGYPVTEWINLPDSFNHLEVLKRSPVDSVLISDSLVYYQSFTLTGFEPGVWSIPVLEAAIGKKKIYSEPIIFTVAAVPLKDSVYHDIREIITVSASKDLWRYYLVGILSLIALGVLIGLLIKRYTGKRLLNDNRERKVSPLEEALTKIKSLKAEPRIEKEDWKNLYSELTDIFKVYIGEKFNFPARQKTTDELLMFLQNLESRKDLQPVVEVMRISDAVKFAKYEPDRERFVESVHTIETILKFLDHLNR